MNNPTTNTPTDSTPLLLSAWSVTTTATEKHEYRNRQQYIDTPLSRWEAQSVAASRRAVTLRNERAAQLRTLDRIAALEGAK